MNVTSQLRKALPVSNNQYVTITSFVSKKVWANGDETFSFKMNDYVKNKLMGLPDCYLSINKKKDPSEKEVAEGNLYYLSAKLPEGQQQAQAPATVTF